MTTSPAPNAGAAMEPGVAALGGGGEGGDGDADGKGGKDGNGGGEGGGGDGAGGDGKNAASGSGKCGGKGACAGPHPENGGTTGAGDPVDVITGRVYTTPAVDLFLPGPLPLEFRRSYNSAACDHDVGLGYGWGHSFAWEVEVGRRSVRIWKDDATAIDFAAPQIGETVLGRDGWTVRREPWGYLLDTGEDRWLAFSYPLNGGKRYRLTSITDENHNQITVRYEDSRIVEIVDSVGRIVRVRSDAAGRINCLQVKNAEAQARWISFATYAYDNGDLIAVTDAAGVTATYVYSDHLMTAREDPEGFAFHFRYDSSRRCVETWGQYPDRIDPSLAPDLPEVLADNQTRAKGFFHAKLSFYDRGYSEVVDSRRVQRFFANEFGKLDKAVTAGRVLSRTYDASGNEASFTDATDATTIWERDARGRITKRIDPIGRTTTVRRDPAGRPIEEIDPAGGVTRTTYDQRGNVVRLEDPLGAAMAYEYDDLGDLSAMVWPNGGRTVIRRDAHRNIAEVFEPNGATWRATYDYLGRRSSVTDPFGATMYYSYNDRGDLTAIRGKDGGVTRYDYDRAGFLIRETYADGTSLALVRAGFHQIHEIHRTGTAPVRFWYNRERQLVRVQNERGEFTEYTLNALGMTSAVRTFDGRRLEYEHDLAGRIVRCKNASGHVTAFEYDLAGQLLRRVYHDDSVDEFCYDALGNVISARNGSAECLFVRDANGRIVAERQNVDGFEHQVVVDLDVMGNRARLATSLGHEAAFRRDVMGRASDVLLDGGYEVSVVRDLVSREVMRKLPSGAQIVTSFDAMGRISRRQVRAGSEHLRRRSNEPEWVGDGAHGLDVDVAYRYSATGELLQKWDRMRGATSFEHDPIGQILAAIPQTGVAERFRYDATGNVYDVSEGAEERVYGPGDRLLRKGATEYVWNREGELVEKRRRGEDGRSDEVWRYTWTAGGLLESVVRPDGAKVAFSYDPFARRVQKSFYQSPEIGAQAELVEVTRFVWDNHKLVHTIRETAKRSRNPIVEERTYCFAEESFEPWAHRTSQGGHTEEDARRWFHYVNDVAGKPERVITEAGEVASEVGAGVWGNATLSGPQEARTPIRFAGQYHDDEVGVSYNRYRYYDPEIGRYISADPAGIGGGLNAFDYVGNRPLDYVDPAGLAGHVTTQANAGGVSGFGASGTGGPLNPDIQAALPQGATAQAIKDKYGYNHNPGDCSEPRALSNLVDKMKEKDKNLTTGDCIKKINDDGIITQMKTEGKTKKGSPKLACPCGYCAHMYNNLGVQPSQVKGWDGTTVWVPEERR